MGQVSPATGGIAEIECHGVVEYWNVGPPWCDLRINYLLCRNIDIHLLKQTLRIVGLGQGILGLAE